MKGRVLLQSSVFGLLIALPLALTYVVHRTGIDIMASDTPALAISILVSCASILAIAVDLRLSKAAHDRVITVTIEDSTGTRTRIVTRSNRRVQEVKRDLERFCWSHLDESKDEKHGLTQS